MSAPKVDVLAVMDALARYMPLAVETEGTYVEIMDESLSHTVASVRGPNAEGCAEALVYAANRVEAADRFIDEVIGVLRDLADPQRCLVPLTKTEAIKRIKRALARIGGAA